MLALTTAFLLVIFVAGEFYRFRRRLTGSIREICPMDGDPAGLMGVRLRVMTPKNGEVTAIVSGCQMCMSRFEIGEKVSLIPGPDGYIMRSSWTQGRRHPACAKGVEL
jgi:hypothetical protein